ncbi:MAG: RNA-dependent RNA polymerase [Narnaviridae sp.]|nr:MAG: RNA-dependent RNA polymerase [Narnaviridae sp.]
MDSVKSPGPGGGLNPPTARTIPVSMDLPEAMRQEFFSKPENWTDQYLSKRIMSNPIVSLCLRLATYQVGPNGFGCFDPKGQSFGSQRLFRMIGRFVGRGTFRRMCHASNRQWKFVEECWIANMHTVLINQCFNPVLLDRKLFGSIQRYKIWFCRFAFQGKILKKRRKNGSIYYRLTLRNQELVLKGLKAIAGWFQYAATSDMKEHNAPPPPIQFWKGWHSELNAPELVWFGGHLSRWRTCLTNMSFSDKEISVLCQIRTFGRALPCPTHKMCFNDFNDQVNILKSEYKTPKEVLDTFGLFSRNLGRRLGIREMPRSTHVSVSTSGCFERTQKEFGFAGLASNWLLQLDKPLNEVFIGPQTGHFFETLEDFITSCNKSPVDLLDVYGELLFPRPISFYKMSTSLRKSNNNLTLLDLLYSGAGISTKRRYFSRMTSDPKPLSPELGKIVLLLSSAMAFKQGTFFNEEGKEIIPYEFIHVGEFKIPIFRNGDARFLTYKAIDMPKVSLSCLAEPGAKTRPLGKNQAWFTFVTRAMRFMVEPILARDGRARIGLRSTNKMWSFLKFIQKVGPEYPDPVGQSTDYKSATDLIPLDLIEVIWRNFLHSLPKGHPFWVYYDLIICPRQMFMPGKFQKLEKEHGSGLLNRRGSFMGEPISFLTLTLVNLLIEEVTSFYFDNDVPLWTPPQGNILAGDPVCICGDDVAALRTSISKILVFKQVVSSIGMKLSWKDAISKRLIIFCEDHALIEGAGKTMKIVYVDVIKSRLLTTMTREHSDNRSSILGKGRMLGNQLDYFENRNIKIACLSYFMTIFDRHYEYSIIRDTKCKLPLYLPPSAGGLGIPIVETVMPQFMFKYIGHVYNILDIQDPFDRYIKLKTLSSLNHRVKHGISEMDINVLAKEISRYRRNGDNSISVTSIYEDDFVLNYLSEVSEVELPPDPYSKKYDFSSLRNEAARVGFVPFSELYDEVERVLNFQNFLKKPLEKTRRSYNQWVRDSKKFWNRVFKDRHYTNQCIEVGKRRFTSVASLDKQITRGFSGWIYVGEDIQHFNLINSGPSMKVNFTSLGKYNKMSLISRMKTYPKHLFEDEGPPE